VNEEEISLVLFIRIVGVEYSLISSRFLVNYHFIY